MTTDPGEPLARIPMPADFRLQVAYWRNHARRERASANSGTDPWTGHTTEQIDQELIEEERPAAPEQVPLP